MATLSELAQTQQTTTVGQAQGGAVGSAGGTSIQSTKQIDKSAGLAKDIGKMFGGLLQEHQQASEYAGKRVGTDNLVEYKQKMGEIAQLYNKPDITSSDMVEKTRFEQGVYEMYMQKGHFSDNDLANQAFRDTYADPAAENLLSTKASNTSKQSDLFKNETNRDVSYAIGVLGADINAENIATFKQQFSSAGLDPHAIDDLVFNASSDSLTTEINTNYPKYVSAGGKIDETTVDAMFNEKYKHYVGSENQAVVANLSKAKNLMNTFLTTKADKVKSQYVTNALTRGDSLTWDGAQHTDDNGRDYRFVETFKEYEEIIRREFPELSEVDFNRVMKRYDVKAKAAQLSYNKNVDISQRIYDNNKQGGSQNVSKLYEDIALQLPVLAEIQNNPVYSKSVQTKARKTYEHLVDMEHRYTTVNSEVGKAIAVDDYIELTKYLQSTRTTQGPLGDTVLQSSFVKNQVSKIIDTKDDELDSIDISSGENQKAFGEGLLTMYKLTKTGAKESRFLTKFGQKFNSQYLNTVDSVSDAYKMVISAKMLSDDSNNAYGIALDRGKIRQLTDILGDPSYEDDTSKLAAFNKKKFSFKINKDKIINGSKSDTKKTLENFNTSYKDDRMESTLLNYVMANDNTGTFKEGMTLDETYDLVQANSITYRVRETDGGISGFGKEVLKAGASFFADSFDGIVIPNRIGQYTDEKGAITDAVTGLLRKHNRQLSEVRVEVSSEGAVMFYDIDSRQWLDELNPITIVPFGKEGRR